MFVPCETQLLRHVSGFPVPTVHRLPCLRRAFEGVSFSERATAFAVSEDHASQPDDEDAQRNEGSFIAFVWAGDECADGTEVCGGEDPDECENEVPYFEDARTYWLSG